MQNIFEQKTCFIDVFRGWLSNFVNLKKNVLLQQLGIVLYCSYTAQRIIRFIYIFAPHSDTYTYTLLKEYSSMGPRHKQYKLAN
jgi:hypothetical protein